MNTGKIERGITFIWENARLLERTIFDYRFRDAPPTRIIQVLRAYQNNDGGFGHGLEPDVRTPESQPLFVEFALRTLYECRLRVADMAFAAIDFLAQHADLKVGIPPVFPSSNRFPRAAHWNSPDYTRPSLDRLVSLVGLAKWQQIDHPWLDEVVNICLNHIDGTQFSDAHTILNAFCLLESVSEEIPVDALFNKLREQLFTAHFFNLAVPVNTYGLTPLTFAPTPDAYCRCLFTDDQINAHLDDLAAHQQEDGGWPITWDPPGKAAFWEWRAYWTLVALSTLKAFGRIDKHFSIG